jgi:hypothetical protein
MRRLSKQDVAAFPPSVQFRYQRELEPPDASEGFASIERVAFNRRRTADHDNRALVMWCDDVLWRSRSGQRVPTSADDVEVPAGRGDVLRRYRDEGWTLCGLSWQPDIGDNDEGFRGAVERLHELLGVPLDVDYCPHPAGPPICWCRKPLPGLGVVLITRHRLNPAESIYVGGGSLDPGFARRLGFQYRGVEDVFG